jgi:hypothetical protein
MATFQPNRSFHRDLGRRVQGAMQNLENAIDEVARTHAGRPEPEFRAALASAISGAGVQPDPDGVRDMARKISAGSPAS